jgi:hypothetical protein
MKNVYEVLRQKELEVSRLQKEVEALRVAAPLLSEDTEAEDDHQPTLQRAVNDTPQPDPQWVARQSQKVEWTGHRCFSRWQLRSHFRRSDGKTHQEGGRSVLWEVEH